MKTAVRRRTSPLFTILVLAVLLFSAGLLAGWTGASVLALAGQKPLSDIVSVSDQPLPTPTLIPALGKPSLADGTTEWNLLLVNFETPLSEDFNAPELIQLRNGHSIDSRAYPALQRMMDDCSR